MEKQQKSFREQIKPLIDKGNFTLQEVAIVAGVSKSSISRYFSGVSEPPDHIAERIIPYMAQKIEMLEEMSLSKNSGDEQEKQKQQSQDHIKEKELYESILREKDERMADKTKVIDELKIMLNKQTRQSIILTWVIIGISIFIVLILGLDIMIGDIGWIRY